MGALLPELVGPQVYTNVLSTNATMAESLSWAFSVGLGIITLGIIATQIFNTIDRHNEEKITEQKNHDISMSMLGGDHNASVRIFNIK